MPQVNKPGYIASLVIQHNNEWWEDRRSIRWQQWNEYDPRDSYNIEGAIPFNGEYYQRFVPVGRLVALQTTKNVDNLSNWLNNQVDQKYLDNAFALNTYTGNGCRLWRYTDWQGYRLDIAYLNIYLLLFVN